MSRRPTLGHRIEYALYVAATSLGRALSRRSADRLGGALGQLGYWLGIRRGVTLAQLRLAFPDQDEAWIRRVARASYAHLGRETLAILRIQTRSKDEVVQLTRAATTIQAFEDAARSGSGVVVVTGHLGNWEVAGAAVVSRGLPLDVVIQKQANPLFDRAIVQQRERLGMRVIYKRRAPREALAALRAGRVVAFVSDQDARQSGVFVPFFGRLASTARGPALMAVRTGAPLFLGYAIRQPDGGYASHCDEIVVSRDGSVDDVVERLTAAFTARLEAMIRQVPDQYFWQHRRWKTRPIGTEEDSR